MKKKITEKGTPVYFAMRPLVSSLDRSVHGLRLFRRGQQAGGPYAPNRWCIHTNRKRWDPQPDVIWRDVSTAVRTLSNMTVSLACNNVGDGYRTLLLHEGFAYGGVIASRAHEALLRTFELVLAVPSEHTTILCNFPLGEEVALTILKAEMPRDVVRKFRAILAPEVTDTALEIFKTQEDYCLGINDAIGRGWLVREPMWRQLVGGMINYPVPKYVPDFATERDRQILAAQHKSPERIWELRADLALAWSFVARMPECAVAIAIGGKVVAHGTSHLSTELAAEAARAHWTASRFDRSLSYKGYVAVSNRPLAHTSDLGRFKDAEIVFAPSGDLDTQALRDRAERENLTLYQVPPQLFYS